MEALAPEIAGQLSAGALHLYRIIDLLSRKEGHCWMGQEDLAAELGRSPRMVRYYLVELAEAGLVECRRRGWGRTNHYRLRAVSERQHIADHERQHIAAHQGIYKVTQQNSSASAAAVSEPRAEEAKIPALVERLIDQGLDVADATNYARRDPELAELVAAVFGERKDDPGQKPLANPIGYLLGMLRCPNRYGFRKPGEKWERPQPEGQARQMRRRQEASARAAAEREQSMSRQRENTARLEAECRRLQRNQELWAQLPPAEQTAIQEAVLAKIPLFLRQKPGAASMERLSMQSPCFDEMHLRHPELGKDPL